MLQALGSVVDVRIVERAAGDGMTEARTSAMGTAGRERNDLLATKVNVPRHVVVPGLVELEVAVPRLTPALR